MAIDYRGSSGPRKRHPVKGYKREQARISRRRMYPVAALYLIISVTLCVLAYRTGHLYIGLAAYLTGVPVWTVFEYLMHRHILHVHFIVKGTGLMKTLSTLANKYFDPLHFEHHARPFDAMHVSGRIRDMLPIFMFFAAISWIFLPWYVGPMLMAGFAQSYIAEEWIHHCTHYYNFRDPYFRYMKKHHLYHHTSQGMAKGFGTSSGLWDVVFRSRYPEPVRQRLYGSRRRVVTTARAGNSENVR